MSDRHFHLGDILAGANDTALILVRALQRSAEHLRAEAERLNSTADLDELLARLRDHGEDIANIAHILALRPAGNVIPLRTPPALPDGDGPRAA